MNNEKVETVNYCLLKDNYSMNIFFLTLNSFSCSVLAGLLPVKAAEEQHFKHYNNTMFSV